MRKTMPMLCRYCTALLEAEIVASDSVQKNLRLCLVRLKVIAKRPFAYSQKLSVDLSVTHNIKKIVNKINNEKWQKMLI